VRFNDDRVLVTTYYLNGQENESGCESTTVSTYLHAILFISGKIHVLL